MKHFILEYIKSSSIRWKVQPEVLQGEELQDCLILVFGKPKVAAFAHMDTTGFTVRYQDQLIPIGGPQVSGKEILVGHDALGEVECQLGLDDEGHLCYKFGRAITSGTNLVFKPSFKEEDLFFSAPYLDNRVGICNLLKLAEYMECGALVFSGLEEHGGGTVPNLVRILYEKYAIKKMLVSDVTWASEGVRLDNGVVVSFRDRNIPRRSFVDEIVSLAKHHDIHYQVEVEAGGSSDGREIQISPYPIDWCFVGAPIDHMHSDHEKIAKGDFQTMLKFYQIMMQNL
jgi:putative aminopeptidase FrvX